jgi:uncharacterized protein YcgI (DUF1989 family)
MKTTVTDHDYVDIRTAESTPGDRVEFKAQRDSHVAITACADEGTVNGNNPTPIDLELPDDTDVFEG